MNVCQSRYITLHHAICNRTCKLYNSASVPQWMLGKPVLNESGSATNNIELDPFDWVCENCFNAIVYPRTSGKRQSKYVLTRSKVLEHALVVLHADEACMISNLMDMYRFGIINA